MCGYRRQEPSIWDTRRMWIAHERELVDVHVETGFVLNTRGRSLHETAPDRSPGPRFRIEGCATGNVVVVRDDVDDDVANDLTRLAAEEPPLCDAEATPVHLGAYLNLLGSESDQPQYSLGLNWVFPQNVAHQSVEPLIRSGTPEGERLLERLPESMHPSLVDIGFRTPEDVWAPWAVAVDDDCVVCIAETVRGGRSGAAVGVDTAVGYRGRGLGAATTAAWSHHNDLSRLTLFYGTSRSNLSSRRLVERLNLTFLGSSLSVS